jgi:hypothetical protein
MTAGNRSADPGPVDPVDLHTSDLLDDFVLLPGLLRRWEVSDVIKPDSEHRIEDAGETTDHTPLFAVYRRDPPAASDAACGVPVMLSFEGGRLTVRARLLPIGGDLLMGVVVLGDNFDDSTALVRIRDHLARSTQAAREQIGRPGEPKADRQEGAP